MTPSGIHIHKALVATIVGVIVLVVVGYKYSGHIAGTVTFWRSKSESGAKTIMGITDGVEEGDLKISVDNTEVTVHYRHAEPDVCSLDVLFLHGQAFTSKTWFDSPMKSLQVLSKLGYNVVAIDLPGYGQSPEIKVDPVRYLEEVIKGLKLNKPVIVSPSMSGGFSLPYLFKDPENVLSRARGFIPVAPVGTDHYTKEQYSAMKIPTLIICGDKDTRIGPVSVKNLQQLPNSELKMYKDSGHPAYLNRPEDFHKDLDTFFKKLLENRT